MPMETFSIGETARMTGVSEKQSSCLRDQKIDRACYNRKLR